MRVFSSSLNSLNLSNAFGPQYTLRARLCVAAQEQARRAGFVFTQGAPHLGEYFVESEGSQVSPTTSCARVDFWQSHPNERPGWPTPVTAPSWPCIRTTMDFRNILRAAGLA